MIRFYRWEPDFSENFTVEMVNPNWRIEDEYDLLYHLNTVYHRLTQGKPIPLDEWDSNLCLWVVRHPQLPIHSLTDVPILMGIPIVHSPRLKNLMENIGMNQLIQYIPVSIIDRWTKQNLSIYYFANFLSHIDCLDTNRTTFDEDGLIKRAVLQKRLIQHAPLFYVEGKPPFVVVREDVKKAIERAGITGCQFEEIEVV